jgi:hypothetical protein
MTFTWRHRHLAGPGYALLTEVTGIHVLRGERGIRPSWPSATITGTPHYRETGEAHDA